MKQILTAAFILTLGLHVFAQPGAPDTQYGTDGWVKYTEGELGNNGFTNMGIQPDGKLIVYRKRFLGRYNTNGTFDNSFFNNNGWRRLDFDVFDIAVQSDGSILVLAGSRIYKLTSNGLTDDSWGDQGSVKIELTGVQLVYKSIALDTKGRIVLAGRAEFGDPAKRTTSVARLNADGALDLTFNGGGIKNQIYLDDEYREGIECGVDGNDNIFMSVFVGDYIYGHQDVILKYKPDGKLDLGFGGGDGELAVVSNIERLKVDASGKFAYTTGQRDDVGFVQLFYLNPDGTGISSRTLQLSQGIEKITAIGFQPNGKVVFAGFGNQRLFVIRLNADGTTDQSFSNDLGRVDFLGNRIIPMEIIFYNNRLLIGGLNSVLFGINVNVINDADAFILALDGTDKRLKCNGFFPEDIQPHADPGKCYKTLNNSRYDPTFIPSTATGTVQYQIKRNNVVVEQGTGSINGKDFPVGQTQVTYTFTDITSNTCNFTITVSDKEPPVAKTKKITAQLNASGTITIAAADVDDGSTDGCSIQSMTISKTSFDCSNVGTNTVTFTVKDASNNTSTATATVTVEDKVVPDARCKNVTIYLDATGKASISSANIDNGSSDACGIKSLSLSKTQYDCSNKGSNTVTLTATDNNNNTSACTATVTVVDNLSPIITSVVPNPANLWSPDGKMKNVTVNVLFTDNCPGTTYKITKVVIKQNPGDNSDWQITGDHTVNLRAVPPKKSVYRIYTITITFTDAAGNTSSSNTDVIVAPSATITKSNTTTQKAEMEASSTEAPGKFNVAAYPNPTTNNFSLTVQANTKERIIMQVIDMYGRTIETRNVNANSIIKFGDRYRAGTYFVRIIQGKEHKEIKLIKLSD